MIDIGGFVSKLSVAPEDRKGFQAWVEAGDVVPFLRANVRNDELILELSGPNAFLRAVVVPKSKVSPPDVEDLMSWNADLQTSWGIEISYSQGSIKSIWIAEPTENASCKTFREGERLVFLRKFEGRQGDKHYYEILQKFAHVFDIHFLVERSAYCRLDERGDIEDVVRVIEIPGRGDRWGTTVVAFNRRVVDEYLTLTNSVLVLTFDFTRFSPRAFGGWHQTQNAHIIGNADLFYRSHIESGHASFIRGVQIIPSGMSKEELIKKHDSPVAEKREYASFLAFDFKNRVLGEISTAPDAIANYFTKSDLPFEMSPAFFRPEVLLKYKNDSEKYRLDDRSISCRNAWHLETYDVNEAGQVHTYLVYLQRLPYEEQLYWKSFNERPKASISNRAFTTDFEGNWHTEYDPLNSLKQILRELDQRQVPWWTLRSEGLLSRTHYPATTSSDEWSNEVLNLDQMLIEGFEERWLRKKANELGREPDPKFKSLKLIEECLVALHLEEDDARKLAEPLHRLHNFRSKLKGHASGDSVFEIRKKVLSDHGTYRKHFHALCAACDQATRQIAEYFKLLT